jgi:O-antigen/teichoic acid export membrane protein
VSGLEEPPAPAPPISVARASLLTIAAKAGGNAGYFVAALVLAHALDPADRGRLAFITVTVFVTSVVAGGGFREAHTVFLASRPADRPALASNLLLFGPFSGLVGGVLIGATLGLLPGIRPHGIGATEIALAVVAVAANAMLLGGLAMALGLSQFRVQAFVQPLYTWSYALALAAFWQTSGLDVRTAVILFSAAQLLGAILLFVPGVRVTGLGRPSLALLRGASRFAVRAWVGALASEFGFRSDQLLMGFISTERQLGIYAVAVNAAEVPLYVPQSVANTLLPIIAVSAEGDREERTLRVYRLVTLTTLAVVAVGLAGGWLLIPVVFGRAFSGSVTPFLWLLPGAIGFVSSSIFSAALAAASAPGRSSVGPFVTLVVSFALDLALIPQYGASGAAVASTIGFFAGGAAALVAFRHLYALRWRLLLPQREDLRTLAGFARRARTAAGTAGRRR